MLTFKPLDGVETVTFESEDTLELDVLAGTRLMWHRYAQQSDAVNSYMS